MANDYGVIEKKLIRADANGVYASTDAWYGPWDSLDAFYEYLGSILGKTVTDSDIPDATQIGVKSSGGDVTLMRWVKPNDQNLVGYWKEEGKGKGVIHIAGVLDNATKKMASTTQEGTADNIYYIKSTGFLGYVGAGLQPSAVEYYPVWKNCLEYGTLDESGNVVPFDGRLYVTKEGQVFLSTSADIQEISGGGLVDLDEDQQEALDSGITKALVQRLEALATVTDAEIAELKKLRAMNIEFSATNDVLSITDRTTSTRRSISLTGGEDAPEPVTRTYGTPTISFGYTQGGASIGSAGGSYNPIITITQKVYDDDVETETLTYSSLAELAQDFIVGDSISFAYDPTTAATFASLNQNTGAISVNANSGDSDITVKIKLSLTLHGMAASSTISVVQTNTTPLYVTSMRYVITDHPTIQGTKVATPYVTASDNNEYSITAYAQLSNVMGYTFEAVRTTGFTFDSATGIITFSDLATAAAALNDGQFLMNPVITLKQENHELDLEAKLVELYELDVTDGTWNTDPCFLGVRGYQSTDNRTVGGGRIYKGMSASGTAGATLEASAGDILLLKCNIPFPGYFNIFESKLLLVKNEGGVASLANSSKWASNSTDRTGAIANFNTFVANVGGCEAFINLWYPHQARGFAELYIVYKVKGDVTYDNGMTRVTPVIGNWESGTGGNEKIYYKWL